MSKNNIKKTVTEVTELENTNEVEVVELETAMEEVVKPKKSLKKKLMIAGGAVGGLILGALVLGCKKSNTTVSEDQEESEDCEESDTSEIVEDATSADTTEE